MIMMMVVPKSNATQISNHLVDATLAVLSDRLELPVWTYDFHFDVMQIDMWCGLAA